MNQIERLKEDLARRFPDLPTEIDEPVDERGSWFLDIARGGGLTPVVVEWRPDRGFGVSTPTEDDYGVKPDELYPNVNATLERVVALILSGGRSKPPAEVRLAELRQILGLSQTELAERAGLKQAHVSRIENRDDILVSTLAGVVNAMGAELVLLARFPGAEAREVAIRLRAVRGGASGPAEKEHRRS